MLTGCPLMAVPLPLRQGPTAAAAVRGGEVIIALPLCLQPQLVPVVLNVRLLLQSQVHLQRGKSAGCKETWGDENGNRLKVLVSACGKTLLCVKRHVWMKDHGFKRNEVLKMKILCNHHNWKNSKRIYNFFYCFRITDEIKTMKKVLCVMLLN